MPLLPLPPLEPNGVPIDGGDLIATDSTNVALEWAAEIQGVPIDPIRDTIQQGQVGLLLEYQKISSYAAAQSDPGRAIGEYLDDILDEHGCPRKSGQDDDAARAVMFAQPPVVSPTAIVALANNILAPYTTVSCRYAEKSDGWFVSDGTPEWSSHVFSTQFGGFPAGTPNYPDRPNIVVTYTGGGGTGATGIATEESGVIKGVTVLTGGTGYTSAPIATIGAEYGGAGAVLQAFISGGSVILTNVVSFGAGYSEVRRPPGAMPNADTYGRWFLLRTQDISNLDSELAALFNGLQNEPLPPVVSPGVAETNASVGGFFVSSGTFITDLNVTYLFEFAAATVDDIYNSLIASVDAAVGSSIRWDLIADPLLAA